MKKGLIALLVIGVAVVAVQFVNKQGSVAGVKTNGFDQFGYNETAKIFNGTGSGWCQGKLKQNEEFCDNYMGAYAGDKLVMKWNADWDRGNAENWATPPYNAWTDNEWNGRPNGSGEIWHYKIAWDAGCAGPNHTPSGAVAKGTATCVWGPFAMLMSQGSVANRSHAWDVLLKPAGY